MTMPPLAEMIDEVRRELVMRRAVYPRLIAGGKLEPAAAARRIELMCAVLAWLEAAEERVARPPDLFDGDALH